MTAAAFESIRARVPGTTLIHSIGLMQVHNGGKGGGLMGRWLAWIGNIVSMALGGSVVVDLRTPASELTPADAAASRWAARTALLAPLAVLILILVRVPWPIVGAVAAILLLPLVIHRIQVLRGR